MSYGPFNVLRIIIIEDNPQINLWVLFLYSDKLSLIGGSKVTLCLNQYLSQLGLESEVRDVEPSKNVRNAFSFISIDYLASL